MPESLRGPEARSQRPGVPQEGGAKGPDPPSPGRAVGIGLGKDNWGKARAPTLQNQVMWGRGSDSGKGGVGREGKHRILWGSETPCQPL